VSLGLGATVLTVAVAAALWRSKAIGPTLPALRSAVLGLAVTVGLGITLAGGLSFGGDVPGLTLTGGHAAWGLLAWALTLICAVAYLVVPMFQLTPGYPARFAFWLPRVLLGAVALWSLGAMLQRWVALAGYLLGAAAVCAFAVFTWQLQNRR